MSIQFHKLLPAIALIMAFLASDAAWAQRGGRGGGGGFSPDQIFDRLDQNEDGRLSPEEMSQSRGFSITDIARQNGLNPDNGISKEDFSRVWSAQFQQREAGGGGGFGGGGFGGGGPGGGGPGGGGFGGPPGGGGFGGPGGGGFGGPGGGGFPAPGGEGGAPMGPGGGQWGGGGGGQWGGGGGQWGGGGGQWGGGGGQWGGGQGQGGGGEGGGRSSERERPRVTFDLPGSYTAGDSDGDNQIGLNEWTSWKTRSAMREFLSLDADGDGFLTPQELGAGGSSSSRSSSGAIAAAPAGGAPPSNGRPEDGGDEDEDDEDRSQGRRNDDGDGDQDEQNGGGNGSPPAEAPPAAPTVSLEDFEFDAASPRARGAANDFGLMDKNDDGRINADEWAASQRIRPQFVNAGIDISGEMEQDEFIKTYLWIQSQRR